VVKTWRKSTKTGIRAGGGNWALSAYLEQTQTQAISKTQSVHLHIPTEQKKSKLRGLSPGEHYTDRATAFVGEVSANFF
jgi:hypothetical protein